MGLFDKLFSFLNPGSSSKGNNVFALDIGSSSVKVVQLKKDGGRVILETYGELSTGPYNALSVGQAVSLDTEKITQVIADILKEANVTAKNGAIAIPLRSSLLLNLEIPAASRPDLVNVVPLEARKYVPVPISEVELDWWEIPDVRRHGTDLTAVAAEKQAHKQLEILAVAIHKDTVSQYRGLGEKLSLNLSLFEIETFSAIRSVMRNDLSATVVMDLGAGSTKVTIVDYGMVRASHTINKGAQDLSLALSRSLDVTFEKAEEIKRQVGLVEEWEEGKITNIVNPALEYIFQETNRVMTGYQKKSRRAIDKVILLGGGALLKGVYELAEESFDVPVRLGTAFDRTEYPAFMEKVLREAGPIFAVAIGLALRKLEEI